MIKYEVMKNKIHSDLVKSLLAKKFEARSMVLFISYLKVWLDINYGKDYYTYYSKLLYENRNKYKNLMVEIRLVKQAIKYANSSYALKRK